MTRECFCRIFRSWGKNVVTTVSFWSFVVVSNSSLKKSFRLWLLKTFAKCSIKITKFIFPESFFLTNITLPLKPSHNRKWGLFSKPVPCSPNVLIRTLSKPQSKISNIKISPIFNSKLQRISLPNSKNLETPYVKVENHTNKILTKSPSKELHSSKKIRNFKSQSKLLVRNSKITKFISWELSTIKPLTHKRFQRKVLDSQRKAQWTFGVLLIVFILQQVFLSKIVISNVTTICSILMKKIIWIRWMKTKC